MEAHREELSMIESLDSGAVYTLALKTHVGMSVDAFRYFAGWCDKIQVGQVNFTNCVIFSRNGWWLYLSCRVWQLLQFECYLSIVFYWCYCYRLYQGRYVVASVCLFVCYRDYSKARFPLPEFTARVHRPCWRPMNSGAFVDTRVDGPKNAPELTGCQLGCIFWHPSTRVSKNAPEFTGRELGPSTRVVETVLKSSRWTFRNFLGQGAISFWDAMCMCVCVCVYSCQPCDLQIFTVANIHKATVLCNDKYFGVHSWK